MRIKHHYALPVNTRLMDFLRENRVAYKTCPLPGSDAPLCIFDLYEGQECLRTFKTRFPFCREISKSPKYSKAEIENAKWLSVRSGLKKVEWEYQPSAFLLSCEYSKLFSRGKRYKHEEQISPLTVIGPMKWSAKMYFSGPNAADDILFCSKQTRDALDGKWNGLDFLRVMNGKGECHNDLYQLAFQNQLPIEALSGGKKTICRTCGRTVLRLKDGTYQLELREQYVDGGNSVYTTGNVLADWAIGFPTYAINIVPQSFYQYCERNGMNYGMIYEPVNLIWDLHSLR